jgi:hypothetical protein
MIKHTHLRRLILLRLLYAGAGAAQAVAKLSFDGDWGAVSESANCRSRLATRLPRSMGNARGAGLNEGVEISIPVSEGDAVGGRIDGPLARFSVK